MHEGRSEFRLPTLSKEWIKKIRDSADFLGFNYYTSRFVEWSNGSVGRNPSYERDQNLKEIVVRPEFKSTGLFWLRSYPKGLGDLLR